MAFTVTNLCGLQIDLSKYQRTDQASLIGDCVVVAALVTVVCLVVIGKIDLGLGKVGTMSNPWMQGFVGAAIGIFVVDGITALIKYRSEPYWQPRFSDRLTQLLAGEKVAGVTDTPEAIDGIFVPLSEECRYALTNRNNHPNKAYPGTHTTYVFQSMPRGALKISYEIRVVSNVLSVSFAKQVTLLPCKLIQDGGPNDMDDASSPGPAQMAGGMSSFSYHPLMYILPSWNASCRPD